MLVVRFLLPFPLGYSSSKMSNSIQLISTASGDGDASQELRRGMSSSHEE